MNIKFSQVKMFAWMSILLMSFIMFFDSCVEQTKSAYKVKLVSDRSHRYGSIDFLNLDSRYEVGDTIVWDDYLYVILKKISP